MRTLCWEKPVGRSHRNAGGDRDGLTFTVKKARAHRCEGNLQRPPRSPGTRAAPVGRQELTGALPSAAAGMEQRRSVTVGPGSHGSKLQLQGSTSSWQDTAHPPKPQPEEGTLETATQGGRWRPTSAPRSAPLREGWAHTRQGSGRAATRAARAGSTAAGRRVTPDSGRRRG